jgi:putative ATP-dependent endonuclease of the OLD family
MFLHTYRGIDTVYISELTIKNFRSFGPDGIAVQFQPGLTALVGENDSGKTAIIDALRFLLGTTDQEWLRFTEDDFHKGNTAKDGLGEISISARFSGLLPSDKAAFVEYLTYGLNSDDETAVYLTLTAKRKGTRAGRMFISTELRSGLKGEGPSVEQNCRELLAATYLRPLRDAERELSSGKGSRLSMVLQALDGIDDKASIDWDEKSLDNLTAEDVRDLGLLGIGDYFNKLIENNKHIGIGKGKVNTHLEGLQLFGDQLAGSISVSSSGSDSQMLRQLLEKLTLGLDDNPGRMGLGSNNVLFMACELILLTDEKQNAPLLLVEEPEAHVHAQRQIRLVQYLQKISKPEPEKQKPQIIMTTHSPNLASEINLENLVVVKSGQAFSLAEDKTKLDWSDYKFLQRFLDVTKANLFFARGVMIVEGDAENILIPTIAKLIGMDFSKYGVSIVNVGGVGFRRYAKIFMRKDEDPSVLDVPVACLADMDVMPDCGPYLTKKDEYLNPVDWPSRDGDKGRRWIAKSDLPGVTLENHRGEIISKANQKMVKTFVADEWTLEYDLAYSNENSLSEYVYRAAQLAIWDEKGSYSEKNESEKLTQASEEFEKAKEKYKSCAETQGWINQEVTACLVYARFTKGGASKSIAAQYLAKMLEDKFDGKPDELRQVLPEYLVKAINHVTTREQ